MLVVTHGLFLRMLIATVLLGKDLTGPEYKRFFDATLTKNTGISVLQFLEEEHARRDRPARRGWILYVYNDHAHLG